MALVVIFIFGIGNFAVHRAVMESGHPMLGQIAFRAKGFGRRIAFGSELLILIAALALALNGYPAIAWAYGIYSLLNIGSAWLILTGRI